MPSNRVGKEGEIPKPSVEVCPEWTCSVCGEEVKESSGYGRICQKCFDKGVMTEHGSFIPKQVWDDAMKRYKEKG